MKKPRNNASRSARRNICGALVLLPFATRAQLRVEITGVGGQQFPIAIAPFAQEGAGAQDVDAIVRADLARSGLFRIIDAGAQPIAENANVNLADWKTRGADALVIGSSRRLADGRFDVRFRLLDTVKQTQLDGLSYLAPAAELRLTAHRIADRIYEKLTGERGVFATRIAYVVQTSRNSWELHVADADGANSQAALRSREPIISPAWASDGIRLAYVSFETGKPVVYVHTVTTGERKAVANFRGSNSAPAWSPDGRSLAVTLTREGNSQIFLMNADGSNVRRITQSSGIDTEPVFSPDGQWIYFTSDRGGGPQIYRMPARRRCCAAHDLRRRLQHQSATVTGRQADGVRCASQRTIPGHGPRPRERYRFAGDRHRARRITELCPERPAAAVCDRSQRPRHPGVGVCRRPRKNAAFRSERGHP